MLKTLRWLLVALLPFVGLYAGSAFIAEHQPLWNTTLQQPAIYLGLTSDDSTVLLLEHEMVETSTPPDRAVVGIDAKTGKILFRLKLPESLLTGIKLSIASLTPDGTSIVLIDSIKNEVLLYHWKEQRIVRRFSCRFEGTQFALSEAVLRGSTLIARGYSYDDKNFHRAFVAIWDMSIERTNRQVFVGEQATGLRVSDDGSLAAVVTTTNKAYAEVIVDTVAGKIIHIVPKSIYDVRWSSDNQRMYLLTRENYNTCIETFVRQADGYVSESKKVIAPSTMAFTPVSPYFVTTRSSRQVQPRLFLEKLLGNNASAILDPIMPAKLIMNLYDPASGETFRSLLVPESILKVQCYPDRQYQGLFVPQNFSLAYWSFTGPSTWPKWLGLASGLVAALLLARQNLWLTTKSTASLPLPPPI